MLANLNTFSKSRLHSWLLLLFLFVIVNNSLANEEYSTYYDSYRSSRVNLDPHTPAQPLAAYILPFLLESETFSTTNHTGFRNKVYDSLLKQVRIMREDNELANWTHPLTAKTLKLSRRQMIQKCLNILHKECPWIVLYHDREICAFNARVKNARHHPFLIKPIQYYQLEPKDSTATPRKAP